MADLAFEGPEEHLRELAQFLSDQGLQGQFRSEKAKQFTGGDELRIVLEIVGIAVHVTSIWLSTHHVARELIALRKDGRPVDLTSIPAKAEEIEKTIEDT